MQTLDENNLSGHFEAWSLCPHRGVGNVSSPIGIAKPARLARQELRPSKERLFPVAAC